LWCFSETLVKITDFGLAKLLDVKQDTFQAEGGKVSCCCSGLCCNCWNVLWSLILQVLYVFHVGVAVCCTEVKHTRPLNVYDDDVFV
jgi:hypothetical protein